MLRTAPSGFQLLQPHQPHLWIHPVQVQTALAAVEDRYAPVIIDNPCGLPSESPWTTAAGFSVVLVVRPDEYSLTAAAEALVWMHDQHLVTKQQVTVVLNYGAGTRTRGYIPAASALAIRCRDLHLLPADPHLGPGPTPPFARPVPDRLRLRLAQICLEIWHTHPNPHPPPCRPSAGRPPQGQPMNTKIRATVRLAGCLVGTGLLALTPALAWAAPTEPPRKVVDGPDLAAGARNAPGAAAIGDLINTIGFYAIIACLVGLLLSGLILVIGPRLGFDRASSVGKVGIFAALGGAFLIGISATLVNFFYNAGA